MLRAEHAVVTALQGVMTPVLAVPKGPLQKQTRNAVAQQQLREVSLPARFTCSLSPRMECSGVEVEECKIMDSKQAPLWVVFRNADPRGANIPVISKVGDDLRQDQITLQIFRLFDALWLREGLNPSINAYGVTGAGDELSRPAPSGRDTNAGLRFQELCCRAYNLLRCHGNLFMNLFALMVPAGIPELQGVDNILYFKQKLRLDLDDAQAAQFMKAELANALATKTREMDDFAHLKAHQ